jgi:hypothetical protein
MRVRRLAWVALLCALLAGCYWHAAARHAEPILKGGWNADERGPWVVVIGPVATLVAALDFAFRSFIPVELPEPEEKWFRFYTGPMLPLSEVAVLCHTDTATQVHTIRLMQGGAAFPARHRRWHFPLCIEALPGLYELEVHYFLRRTDDVRDETSTRHAESLEPSRVAWFAEPGGVYALRVLIGTTAPASTPAPRSRVSQRSSLGTSRFELEEGQWAAEIERLASWEALGMPVLEHRAAWEDWEGRR